MLTPILGFSFFLFFFFSCFLVTFVLFILVCMNIFTSTLCMFYSENAIKAIQFNWKKNQKELWCISKNIVNPHFIWISRVCLYYVARTWRGLAKVWPWQKVWTRLNIFILTISWSSDLESKTRRCMGMMEAVIMYLDYRTFQLISSGGISPLEIKTKQTQGYLQSKSQSIADKIMNLCIRKINGIVNWGDQARWNVMLIRGAIHAW